MNKHHDIRLVLAMIGAACLLTIGVAQAQTAAASDLAPIDVAALATAAPGAEAYPDEDILVLQRRRTIAIDAEGRQSRRVHTVLQLLTAWAVRRHSDLRVAWDSSRQDLVIHTCRTIMRDGTVVVTPAYGFNEVTPDAVARAADFLDIREMVISHVGTEIGCVTELDYEIRDRRPPPLPAGGHEYLQGQHPVLLDELVIDAAMPMASEVRHLGTLDITLPQAAEESRGPRLWTVRNVPGRPAEANTRHRADYLPLLIYATAPNWMNLAGGWRAHNESAAVLTPDLQAWLTQPPVDGDTEPLTDLDRVQRIASLVGGDVQTVHLPGGFWSRAPRPAARVFSTASGTPWEKGLLALTLLRAEGFPAEIGFFSRAEGFNRDLAPIGRPTHVRVLSPVPAADSYSHLRVVVTVAGENYWLDPERAEAFPGRCDLGGRTGLFFEDGPTYFRTYRVEPKSGQASLTVALKPASEKDGEYAGAFTAAIDLDCDGALWKDGQDAQEIADLLAAAILQDGQATEVDVAEISPFRLRLRVQAEGSGLVGSEGKQVVLALPQAPVSAEATLSRLVGQAADDRQTPLFLPADCQWRLRLDLTLPEGWRVDYLPAELDLAVPAASCRLESGSQDGRVTLRRELSLTAGMLAAEDYPDFRQVVTTALQPGMGQLVLSRD